ncbi:MAG: glycosyltransferase family 2 protein [Acidimicrobiales bacterium]
MDRHTPCPTYSVVVPAFNEEHYIGDCLHSLANQDYTGDYEVIVVDNNSTDNTANIASTLGATVIREAKPGVCSARQRGTEVARGEVVISTDADTTFDSAWLASIDRAFTQNPECVAVAGPCRFDGGPWWSAVYPRLLFGAVYLVYLVTGYVFYVSATNIAFRKSAWSGYNTNMTQGGDEIDLLRRLRSKGRVIFSLRNPSNTSSRRLKRGLLYNLFVSFAFYYLLTYWVNRIAGRCVIKNAPAFRDDPAPRPAWYWPSRVAIAAAAALFMMFPGRYALYLGFGTVVEPVFDAVRRLF